MAKIRVHELAKELGRDKKEIVEYLKSKGFDSITAVSQVPDGELDVIRGRYGDKTAAQSAAQTQPAAEPQPKEVKAEEGDDAKKGSSVVRIYRAGSAAPQSAPRKPQAVQPRQMRQKNVLSGQGRKDTGEKAAEKTQETGDLTAKAPEMAKPAPEKPGTMGPEDNKAAAAPAEKAGAAESARGNEAADKAAETAAPVREAAKAEKPAAQDKPARAETVSSATAASAPAASAPAGSTPAPAAPADKPQEPPKRRTIHDIIARANAPINRPKRETPPETNDRMFQSQSRDGSRAPQKGAAQGRTGTFSQGRRDGDRTRTPGQTGRGQGGPMTGRTGDARGNAAGRGPARDGAQRGGFSQTRNTRTDGASRAPFNRADGQGRAPFTPGRPGGRPAPGGAVPGGAARTSRSAGAARDNDGSLARKTSRDYHGGKDYDKSREERREMGGRHAENTNGKKSFNRIPKAYQNNQPKAEQPKPKEVVTEIKLPERLTIRELAEKMKIQPAQIVKNLFMKGEMVTVNHEVTFEKAQEIALEYDIIAEAEEKEDVIGELLKEDAENEDDMVARPPVVCVMGHVDHGKTSLLDAIRNTHVTDREAGGITQHIGAYMVSVKGQKITFLDTPGHEAFTAMRMRGANSTDIAVLVVAADDGVMPQTIEAINHAKAANVDIIVAINKIDKPAANIDRVKQELSEQGLIPEDWGGQTIFCPVSAKTQEGIDNLLDMILLTAEVDELKANPNRNARGLVLEARLDKGRGPVATILIQKGTLHQGDFIACGAASGKVRAMTDENGRRLRAATPSMPVEIIGLSSVPEAGEVLVAMDSDKEVKDFAATFISEGKKNLIGETKTQMSLTDLFEQIKEGQLKELPIIVKADVQGSVEAVRQSLVKLSNDEVVVKVIHGGVGTITESDVSLASASNAIIIGFNVRPDATAKSMAEAQKVDIHTYSVIYEAIEDVERALKGMRAAVYEEKIIGHAEIRQIFKASQIGNIAGSYVKDGIFQRKCKIRILRGGEKIYEGSLASLKRFKDDVKEVREGFECGLVFDGFGDFQVEDMVEAYVMVEVPRE